MTILRVCYKNGIRFDKQYYLATHLPLACSILGEYDLRGVEVVFVRGSAGGAIPPYQAMFSAHFAAAAALEAALESPLVRAIQDDVPNYYDGVPDILIGETMITALRCA